MQFFIFLIFTLRIIWYLFGWLLIISSSLTLISSVVLLLIIQMSHTAFTPFILPLIMVVAFFSLFGGYAIITDEQPKM
jgi:hypothetical protein